MKHKELLCFFLQRALSKVIVYKDGSVYQEPLCLGLHIHNYSYSFSHAYSHWHYRLRTPDMQVKYWHQDCFNKIQRYVKTHT